ncbi:hypothetical protein HDV05_003287 [Chytridiales sp. JEL 0842]|nr:hypothetical protein HDV05_003287 [Chytridiales sp. JEL 0842]
MVEFGRSPSSATILRATQFLHSELPIRLAHRVVELENLPHDLSHMPAVRRVKDWYTQSYKDLLEFPKPLDYGISKEVLKEQLGVVEWGSVGENGVSASSMSGRRYFNVVKVGDVPSNVERYNGEFVQCIETIKKRHDPVATTLAEGIQEAKDHWKKNKFTSFRHPTNSSIILPLPIDIHSFLDRFYLSRIGIRMLIGQHIALHRASHQTSSVPDEYVGIICTKTNIRSVAMEAAENAKMVAQETYGFFGGPEIRLLGTADVDFMYVPSHLHHMLFELLKNSLRAVVETRGVDADEYPDIKVIVAEGKEDITIKISDEGGGIPRSGMPLIWSYMYTTAERPGGEDGYQNDFRAPMAGFGYGLPLSRLYARYFGGDLKLISMEGYGTDAYLHLSRLSDSEEPLP